MSFTIDHESVRCFLCPKEFSIYTNRECILYHLYDEHRVTVDDDAEIIDFAEYMEYYRGLVENKSLDAVLMTTTRKGSRKLYVLGKSLPNDENIRRSIHERKLKAVKAQHKKDHSSALYKKHCFYCHNGFYITRADFVDHLWSHGLKLGRSYKLVYIEQLVNIIQDLYTSFRCIYCLMKFTSASEMRDHMKVLDHHKINPEIKFFDKFYMINYVEYGKSWRDLSLRKIKELTEKTDKQSITDRIVGRLNDLDQIDDKLFVISEYILCLFCKHTCRTWSGMQLHMITFHRFDFKQNMSKYNFYEQVKIVNYVRQKVSANKCILCNNKFDTGKRLQEHFEISNHIRIPRDCLWDCEEYFNLYIDDDPIIYCLEDIEEDDFTSEYNDSCISKSFESMLVNSPDSGIGDSPILKKAQRK